ncbi:MAG: hypothetical protein Q8S39_04530 [Ignavibacteria bacterium]|nr:hypothetical protein [Ignavibacteria bacterium]
MKNISDYIGQELEIVNKHIFKSLFELKANGIPILSLRSTDFWGNHHEIAGFEKVWELSKPSVWRSTIEVRENNSSAVIATFESSAFGKTNTITLPRGEKLLIVTHIWKSMYELQNELGTRLVIFENKKWYSQKINVTIEKKLEVLDKYPFILLLVFFTVLQRQHQAAAVSV